MLECFLVRECTLIVANPLKVRGNWRRHRTRRVLADKAKVRLDFEKTVPHSRNALARNDTLDIMAHVQTQCKGQNANCANRANVQNFSRNSRGAIRGIRVKNFHALPVDCTLFTYEPIRGRIVIGAKNSGAFQRHCSLLVDAYVY